MKKFLVRLFLVVLLILVPLFITGVFADPPGPPDPGGDPGGGGGTVVGSLYDGIGILLALGIAYGSYKIYEIWKKKDTLKEEEPV